MPATTRHQVFTTSVALGSKARGKAAQPAQASLLPTSEATSLKEQLRARLLDLNFAAFAHVAARLLESAGFSDVRLAGRRDWKGRNGTDGNAGYDLVAQLPGAFGSRSVIISIKQFDQDQPLFQRSLDELVGVAIRTGASEAILLTTGPFSPSIQQPASRIVPLRLVDGEALIEMLLGYQIGVRLKDGAAPWDENALTLDDAFFDELARSHRGNSRADCTGGGEQQFLVTVALEPVPPPRRRS